MSRVGADSEAVAKAKSIARKIEIIPRYPRSRPYMIGGHLPESRLAEILLVIKSSPIEQRTPSPRGSSSKADNYGYG
jgi:hypothetical protein